MARSGLLIASFAIRPPALDELEHRPDLIVAEYRLERRHVGSIARNHGREPELGDLEQLVIRVMPGMTRLIMGWRGKTSRWQPLHPLRLALEVCPVAGRAMRRVTALTKRNTVRVVARRVSARKEDTRVVGVRCELSRPQGR
jgi:hypothetical protein